ncbi:proton-coupled folate transporter-like [Argopecten irradians]|uniref:proton-coupled folate transporter-like n=1 Tax=Argopecten irradians TaxID=31199 RepID=UPI003712F5F6
MDRVSEKRPLLVNTKKQPAKQDDGSLTAQVVLRVTLTFVFMVITELGSLNQTLYIYKRASDLNTNNDTYTSVQNLNATNACGLNQSLASENNNQKLAAKWTWYFDLVVHGLGVLSLLLYGLYCDFIGRKPLLIISLTGEALRYAMMSFINYRNLPFVFFFVPYALSGLTGNSYLFFIASTASIADKTSYSQSRTVGLAVFEVLIGLGGGIAKLGVGYLIKYMGYLIPMLTCFGAYFACSLFVCMFIEDTIAPSSYKHLTFSVGLKRIFGFFYDKTAFIGGRPALFILAWSAFMIIHFARTSAYGITTLFELKSPFCWTSEEIGWFGFIQNIIEFIIGLAIMKILQCCMKDEYLAVLGCLSNIGIFLVMGFATTNFMMYACKYSILLNSCAKANMKMDINEYSLV